MLKIQYLNTMFRKLKQKRAPIDANWAWRTKKERQEVLNGRLKLNFVLIFPLVLL